MKIKITTIINNLLKLICSLSHNVYNNNFNMVFLNKIEFIKQYRQSVFKSENINFFGSVIRTFLELKVRTMAIVYEIIPNLLYDTLYE